MKDFGYIQIEFDPDFKKILHKWCDKAINPSDYIFGEINGENIGGLVVDSAHITVCYGIPFNTPFKEQIVAKIKKITPPTVKISGVNCFHIQEHHAKIIYLLVNDDSGTLKSINEQFKKYISSDLQTTQPFIPHITIGYVSENFNEKTLVYDGPKEIQSILINYY